MTRSALQPATVDAQLHVACGYACRESKQHIWQSGVVATDLVFGVVKVWVIIGHSIGLEHLDAGHKHSET